MAASLLGAAIGAGASLFGGMEEADAAKDAARQQRKAIQKGLNESKPFYEESQNFLSPYIESGTQSLDLINDILGLNGPERQAAALAMYKSSPSASLLDDVNKEAVRQTIGQHAAMGSANSGSATTDLAQRLSTNTLNDFYNWENLTSGLVNTGANVSNQAAGLAERRGDTILGARTGQGTAQAAGTVGAANATVGGMQGATNWLNYALNGNDFSNFLKSQQQPSYASNSTFNLNNLTKSLGPEALPLT